MRQARVYGVAGLAALVMGAVAFAQSTAVPLPEEAPVQAAPLEDNAVAELAETRWGDPQRGATLAGTCAACHGLDGNSVVREIYPSIAGQNEPYMARQLALFKSGERPSPIMQPFAQMLSAQDMRDVGAYYSMQSAGAGIADDGVVTAGDYEGMKFYEVGQQIYRGGDTARQIPACMACHGPTGAGMPGPSYPHVAGQPAWYTARRLQEFRDGTTGERDTRMFQIMHTIAQPLSDEEIQALASYLEGLHPRPDAATRAQMAQLQGAAPQAATPPETPGTMGVDGRTLDPAEAGNPPAGAPGSPEASGIDPQQSAEPVQQQ
ncbi:cytochrome C [Lysobacteraceae bacterium NML91-0213]|nr:cytochrome C [Xanthomonadaceae bacterium NML91-0213]